MDLNFRSATQVGVSITINSPLSPMSEPTSRIPPTFTTRVAEASSTGPNDPAATTIESDVPAPFRIRWNVIASCAIAIALIVGIVLAFRLGAVETPRRDPFQVGLAALKRGDDEAVAEAIDAIQSDPGSANEANLLRAAALIRTGRFDEALPLLDKVEPIGRLRGPTLLFTGEYVYRQNRLTEAEALFKQFVAENPGDLDGRRWLAAVYFDMGANDLAIRELEAVLKIDSGDVAAHRTIAMMQHDFEQYQEAGEHYRQALAQDPPAEIAEDVRRGLAKVLIANNDFKAALDVLKDVRPDALSRALEAESLWSLGRLNDARRVVSQGKKYDPDDRRLLFVEARIALSEGEPEQAVAPLERVLENDPYDAECRYQLAQALKLLGMNDRYEAEIARWEEAKQLLEKLTELNVAAIREPRNRKLRQQLAEVCEKLGRDKLAAMWRRAAAGVTAGGRDTE